MIIGNIGFTHVVGALDDDFSLLGAFGGLFDL